MRLFACACLRQVRDLLTDPRERDAVVVCERFAEGRATPPELEAAQSAAFTHALDQSAFATHTGFAIKYAAGKSLTEDAVTRSIRFACAARCVGTRIKDGGVPKDSAEWRGAARGQADLLREIFGNPFRRITLAPSHLTPTVVSLARAAYDERDLPSGELDPQRLAVLADALEEAGATAELVAHLHGPGPHVRGCFAVDAILGLS